MIYGFSKYHFPVLVHDELEIDTLKVKKWDFL